MKKIFTYLLIGSMAAAVSSCGGGSSVNVEYLPIKVDKGEKWGLVNAKGDVLVSDEFTSKPSCVFNGYFTVEESGGLSVYKVGKKIQVVNDLEGLKEAGLMTEGRMPVVSKGERIRYVDGEGKTLFVLEPKDGKEIMSVSSYFSEGLAAVQNSEAKFGYIDRDGNLVIPMVYNSTLPFKNGYAIVSKNIDDNAVYYVIDQKGDEVLKIKNDYYSAYYYVVDNSVLVTDGSRYSLVDIKSGEYTKLPEKVKDVIYFNEKYIIFKEDGNYGILDREMQTLVRAKYDELSYNGNDLFLAKTDSGKIKIINSQDEEVAVLEEGGEYLNLKEYVSYFYGFSCDFELVSGKKGDVVFYDTMGKKICPKTFYEISARFSETVSSDYFDADGAISKLVSYIDGNKVGNVGLGERSSSFLSGPAENHRGEDTYQIPGLEDGYRYTMTATAKDIDRYFVVSESVPDGYWYRSVYSYNPNSSIDEIHLNLMTVSNSTFDKLAKVFKDKITNKGWTLEKDEKAYQIYRNGMNYMLVTPNGSLGDGLHVYMYTDEFWPQKYSSLISTACSNYNNFTDGASVTAEYEEAPVEEAVEVAADYVYEDTVPVADY